MPLHDWTKVPSGLFHHFHQGFVVHICRELNSKQLPSEYSAIIEKTGSSRTSHQNYIEIHQPLGRVIATVDILSPVTKSNSLDFESFIGKSLSAIRQGIHVLVVDLFPPSERDPSGIHHAIRRNIDESSFELSTDRNRTLVSYRAGSEPGAYVETIGLGEMLPDMPLFVAYGAHVLVPLEKPYMNAWDDTPKAVHRMIED